MGVNLLGQDMPGHTFALSHVVAVKAVASGIECMGADAFQAGRIWIPLDVISEKSEVTHEGESGTLIVSRQYAREVGWTR